MTDDDRCKLSKLLRAIKIGVPASWAKACEDAAVHIEKTPDQVTIDQVRDAKRWNTALKFLPTTFTASIDELIEADKAACRLENEP